MTLIACGINHKTAPLDVRERVAFTPALIPDALQQLMAEPAVDEALILSTCNRTELYGVIQEPQYFSEWLATHHELTLAELAPYLYRYQDEEAVKHLLRVTVGIDSMLLGEPEIFGQVKQAYQLAHEQRAVGNQLQHLFKTAFALTKQIRNSSGINRCPISLGFAATQLAKKVFTNLEKACVLLIGAGETIELVATHLINQGVKRLIVANRSLPKAQTLAKKFYGHSVTLDEIPIYLQEADIVVSATNSEKVILTQNDNKNAVALRKHHPLFLVDLAVPRDIATEVAVLNDVYLYNVDDLKAIVSENMQSRTEAAKHAEMFIEIQTQLFMRELRAKNVVDTICDLRQYVDQMREQEFQCALALLGRGEDPKTVLDQFSQKLANKILHRPSHHLRQAAYDGRAELLIALRQLFGL